MPEVDAATFLGNAEDAVNEVRDDYSRELDANDVLYDEGLLTAVQAVEAKVAAASAQVTQEERDEIDELVKAMGKEQRRVERQKDTSRRTNGVH